MTAPAVVIRQPAETEYGVIVALAGATLGWEAGQPNEALFRWKHLDNPFGPSPMWLAECDGTLAAFRAIMRWEFDTPGGAVAHAGRAVDTATHPSFQGLGLFRRLSLHAVEAMTAGGDDFIFNTPNDQSRPGYLKMGWIELGRVSVGVRVRGVRGAARMARARVPAEKWSVPAQVGLDPAHVLDDVAGVDALLATQPDPTGWRTRRSVEFLRWRYSAGPIGYRAVLASSAAEDGVAFFRVRRRGTATEATLCDVIVPRDDRRLRGAMVSAVLRATGADYVIAVDDRASGLWPLPRQGPRLTWRALCADSAATLQSFELRLGDVELF